MTIVIAGGGTGGHLFPGIAVAQEIRRRHPQARIVFIGTLRGIEARAVPQAGFEVKFISVSGLRNVSVRKLGRGLGLLPWSLVQSLLLLRRLRPQVAISVGGYAAGPAVLAARMLRIGVVVMEQNAVAGWTTRALCHLASQVVAAMPCEGLPKDKTLILGNPVRRALLAVRAVPYEPHAPLHLLVLGGSQGAHALNGAMMQAAPLLAQSGMRLRITHQTGSKDAAQVRASYAQAGLQDCSVTPFIDDMAQAYQACDLLLCRAGATTLAEVTVCGRPSILVPFAAAAGDHQTLNARVLEQAQAAVCVAQSQLTGARVVALLGELGADPPRLRQMAAAAHGLGRPNAVQDIADVVLREVARV